MNIELKELYPLQEGLDKEIAKNHDVTYETTHKKRCLALIVELGELANETRCFKFWSLKGPSAKEVILDEYADGMHFFLSLGIPLKVKKTCYELEENSRNLVDSFHRVYELVINFVNNNTEEAYIAAFQEYLNLIVKLGYTSEDAINAYYKKLGVNYNRQNNAY